MNRSDAKKIAQTITNEQLYEMFKSSKEGIKDWTKNSIVNKTMTKGAAWNILTKDFSIDKNYHILAKINMVREFGEFLPDSLKIKKQKITYPSSPVHKEPDFTGFE